LPIYYGDILTGFGEIVGGCHADDPTAKNQYFHLSVFPSSVAIYSTLQ
jgi:hypothetical protein